MTADRITLPADLAREILYSGVGQTYEGWTFVADTHVDKTRWTEYRRIVVRRDSDGQHYAADYQQGLTENQDTEPWEGRKTAVFERVVPVERIVVDYVTPKAAEQQGGAR